MHQQPRHTEPNIIIHPVKSVYESLSDKVFRSVLVYEGSTELSELSGQENQLRLQKEFINSRTGLLR